jgi:hypothetical protein
LDEENYRFASASDGLCLKAVSGDQQMDLLEVTDLFLDEKMKT